MKIVLASDHAGYPLKCELVGWLKNEKKLNLDIEDIGPFSADSIDYPDFAASLCRHLLDGNADFGILICNSGLGMSMTANRFRGIRAALCLFPRMAYYARHHNNANVLVLGGGITAFFQAREIVEVFFSEGFDGGRHGRRTDKIDTV